jgi:hypothetical protein
MSSELLSPEAVALLNDIKLLVKTDDVLSISVTIVTDSQYEGSAAVIKMLKDKKKELESSKEIVVDPLFRKYREALADYAPVETTLKETIGSIEHAGKKYREKVEEAARLAQLKLDEDARKERERLAAIAKEQEENAAALREAGNIKAAEKWEKKAEIKQVQSQAVVAPTVVSNIPANTRGAFNTRVYYRARVTDQKKLLQYVLDNQQYSLVIVNQSNLDRMAGPNPSIIPGVEFYKK